MIQENIGANNVKERVYGVGRQKKERFYEKIIVSFPPDIYMCRVHDFDHTD